MGVKLVLELPDDLVEKIDRVGKLYGVNRKELVLSSVRRDVDRCLVLAAQAVRGAL